MYLEANTIFDSRYRLVLMLGQGASAQVWLAEDTLSGNLRVAIKIFNAVGSELDSYGKQDFQKEFTTVYNINHQNLLTPTNYSVCDGTPYLVLPYCENGSTSSMVGRCEESDVIKMLHDVAAGLDYLHTHGVIHQDIKPDNIMLDDDLNFLVTDFGISTGRGAGTESYGGTRAYMAPERFSGRSDAAGDVWSLGATAYEMLTGNAPFGDHGGLVQAQGEPVPPIDGMNLSSEFTALLNSTLDPDPAKRPTADRIRRITERKLETGSWKEPRNRTARIGTIAIALVVVTAGVFTWGQLRTKTYYYSDYVEVNGKPVGIGSLFGSEQRSRAYSYRILTRGGKVMRVSLVNGHGKVVDYHDAEHLGMRFPDQEYHYKSDGTVDYMIARNPAGKVLYKFTYSDNNKVVETHYDDERNTPKFYTGPKPFNVLEDGAFDHNPPNIASMQLKYDADGRLVKRSYMSLLKEPAADADGAFGEQYEYDTEGRVTEVITIDSQGNPIANTNGTAARRYKYDEEGNRIEVAFYGIGGDPAGDNHGIHMARFEYDEVGNLTAERYFNVNDEPMASSTSGASGYTYTYGDNGFCTSTTAIDGDGEPVFINDGYVTTRYEDDGNGFNARIILLDDEGNPTSANYENLFCAGIRAEYNDKGLATEFTLLDEDGNTAPGLNGWSTRKYTYNDVGDLIAESYLDAEGNPCGSKRGQKDCNSEYEYDELGRVTTMRNFDQDGNPVAGAEGSSIYRITYTPYGSMSSISNFGPDDKPVNTINGFSRHEFEYDDQGRSTSNIYLDADGRPVDADNGAARFEYKFEQNSSQASAVQIYNASGKLTSTKHFEHDPATGRLIAEWETGPTGSLSSGTAKFHYEYNELGHIVRVWTTDLNDRPVNTRIYIDGDGVTAGEARFTYDNVGNRTSFTIWKADGSPASYPDGTHRSTSRFNNRNLIVESFNYQVNGSPIRPQAKIMARQPEGHFKYDNRGNRTETAIFDGHGNPINTPGGWHRVAVTFDNMRNRTSRHTYNTAGNLVNLSDEFNSAILGWEYDEFGNAVKETYSGADGRLKNAVTYKYNPNGIIIELEILNGNGKKDDSLYGFSHGDYTVAPDGTTYLTATLKNAAGAVVATGRWNKETAQWDMNGQGNSGGSGWMNSIQAMASMCPMEYDSGVVLRSVQYDSSSITYVIANKNISGNDFDHSTVNEAANALIQMTHSELGVPYSVTVHVRFFNRENSLIFSK